MISENFANIMGDIFGTRMSVEHVLRSSGFNLAELPTFGGMVIPYEYWKEVYRILWTGEKGREDLLRLLDIALKQYPGNCQIPLLRIEISETK